MAFWWWILIVLLFWLEWALFHLGKACVWKKHSLRKAVHQIKLKPKKLRTITSLTVFHSKCETCFVTLLYPVCSNMCRQKQKKTPNPNPRKTRGLAPHTPPPWGDDERTKNMWWMWDTSHNVMSSDTQMSKLSVFRQGRRTPEFL